MKHTKLFAMAVMVSGLAVGLAWSAPRLTLYESDFDFGYVPQHSKISHEFWLHSTGDDELKIVKVSPG